MSEISEALQELIEVAIENGRLKERHRIFKIMKQVSLENSIGEYAFISDVWEYLQDELKEQQEKRTKE